MKRAGTDTYSGYILIQTEPDRIMEVCRQVSELDGIRTCHRVTGPFDIIAFAEIASLDAKNEAVVAKIDRLGGVWRTVTCQNLES